MKITKKENRTISFALSRFFSTKSLISPSTISDFRLPNILSRELKLKNNRMLLMSDVGLEHLRNIVNIMHSADISDGLANYSDIYVACIRVIEDCLSKAEEPEGATELIELTQKKLNSEISRRYYVVPFFGLELEGVDELIFGAMKIVRATTNHFDAVGLRYHSESVNSAIMATKIDYWLLGDCLGTEAICEEKFRSNAKLVAGMLAISAASIYEGGATRFRLGIAMPPSSSRGVCSWFSWSEKTKALKTHYKWPKAYNFRVDNELIEQFSEAKILSIASEFLVREKKSNLQDAIAKAVYWYADAHQEDVEVMQLIKYWSCVEVFFSIENSEITKAVSAGLASVLVFGRFKFIAIDSYILTKTKIAKFYGYRSKAVHTASFKHVSSRDVAELSQWVAWMIINMIAFVDMGYTSCLQIRRECERLDTIATRDKK